MLICLIQTFADVILQTYLNYLNDKLNEANGKTEKKTKIHPSPPW